MNGLILAPSFSDWLFGILSTWINYFDEEGEGDADRGDDHTDDDDNEGDGDGDTGTKNKKDDDDDDDDDDDGEDDQGHMIPKSRYDSAAKRASDAEEANDALNAELDTLRSKSSEGDKGPTYDEQLSELDKKIEEARADNKIDDVIRLSKEQRTIEQNMYTEIAQNTSSTAGKQAREQIKLDAVIDGLEELHPTLNQDHDDFNEDLVTEILDLQNAYVVTGKYTPAQAMTRAANLLIPKKEIVGGKKTDVKKNLDAATKQAPDGSDTGENSDKGGDIEDAGQIAEMSMEEFDKLPEATKSRLRGDSF